MTRDDALRQLLPFSFVDFVREFWPLVSPDPLIWGRHLDVLCDYLQRVVTGKVKNLLVNLPPRHSKSLVTSVLFPVWVWLRSPTERIITASYAKKLSTDHAHLSRQLLTSDRFRTLFPGIALSEEANRQDHYRNTAGGERLAVSVGSSTTGFNASFIIVDDLHAVQQAESEAERRAAVDYYRLALSSRAIPGQHVPRIVLGQRVHLEDVSGYVLCHGGTDWDYLVLPMEFNPESAGAADWRTEAGELLWPEAFDDARLKQIKVEHRHNYHILYNQDTEAGSGDRFKREWFRYYTEDDRAYRLGERSVRKVACVRLMAVDFAVSLSSSADYTVCIVADCQGGDVIVKHVFRGRLDGTRIVPKIKAIFAEYKPVVCACENAGQQKGYIDQCRAAGIVVRYCKSEGSKEHRSIPAETKCESGQLWFPLGAPWLADFERELLAFPHGHDDQVDALSLLVAQALRYDRSKPEPSEAERERQAVAERAKHFERLLWAGVDPIHPRLC